VVNGGGPVADPPEPLMRTTPTVVNLRDGIDGRMSVRWAKTPGGRSSSGLKLTACAQGEAPGHTGESQGRRKEAVAEPTPHKTRISY